MRTEDGREKDVSLNDVTPENYICPKGEEQNYHCLIEVVQYDPKTGRKLSVPRLQKFGPRFFEVGGREELERQGYTITILHNPVRWTAEEAARQAEEERRIAEEKAEAERLKAEEERKKMRDEIIAELKAEGMIATTEKKK